MFNYQWLAIGVILIFAARLRVLGRRLPAATLFCSLVSFLVIFSISHTTWFLHKKGALLVSPFAVDDLEIKGRLFRESINRALEILPRQHTSRWALRSPWRVSSYSDAQGLLKHAPEGSALLWARKGQLFFATQDQAVRTLSELDRHIKDALIGDLKLVPSIPLVSLSFEPERDSVRYIARLFGAYHERNPETLYRDAAFYNARWRSFSHRSAAFFLLGNYYLLQSLNSGEVERAELDCALDIYRKALRYIKRNENTALLSALLNNYGVANYISSMVSGKGAEKTLAIKYFAAAFKARKAYYPERVPVWGSDAAIQNLGMLKFKKAHKLLVQKKHKKNRKERPDSYGNR